MSRDKSLIGLHNRRFLDFKPRLLRFNCLITVSNSQILSFTSKTLIFSANFSFFLSFSLKFSSSWVLLLLFSRLLLVFVSKILLNFIVFLPFVDFIYNFHIFSCETLANLSSKPLLSASIAFQYKSGLLSPFSHRSAITPQISCYAILFPWQFPAFLW